MTRYWPIMAIARSPLLPEPFRVELANFYRAVPSEAAFHAAGAVANQTEPVDAPHMVIIQTRGAPDRRVFTGRPTNDEWLRLERAAVMVDSNGNFFVMMDAVH